MEADKILQNIRALVRPYLAILFPTAVIGIGILVVRRLLPIAEKFIDHDIALVIITSVMVFVTSITTAAGVIFAWYFAERAMRKPQ